MADIFSDIQTTIAAYRSKKLKPSSVATELLARLDKENPELNAYLRTYAPEIADAAKKADDSYAAGTARPLEGIFVGIKDNLLVSGTRPPASKMLEGYVAPYTGTAVEKFSAPARLWWGRPTWTSSPSGSSTENSAYGPTKNPKDPSCVPGGSSGRCRPPRSTAGLWPRRARLGTGGSVAVQPAALCGCVGFKPTYGSVSQLTGLMAMASSLGRRSVRFCQLGCPTRASIFDAIRGADEGRDATSHEITGTKKLDRNRTRLKALRSACRKNIFAQDSMPMSRAAFKKALPNSRRSGAKIVDISLPNAEHGLAAYYVIMPAEVSTNLSRFDGVRYPASKMKNAASLIDGYTKSRSALKAPSRNAAFLVGTSMCFPPAITTRITAKRKKFAALSSRILTTLGNRSILSFRRPRPPLLGRSGKKSMTRSPCIFPTSSRSTPTWLAFPRSRSRAVKPTACRSVSSSPPPRDEDMFLLDVAEAF